MTEPAVGDAAFPEKAGTPEDAATDASAQAVIADANRLGLQWQLRPATIKTDSPIMGIYDGDTAAIAMTSMVGSVRVGQRVYAIAVPPSGNFICGFPVGPFVARKVLETTTLTVRFEVPANLRSLTVKYKARVSNAVTADAVRMNINDDPSAGYISQFTRSNNVTVSASNIVTTYGIVGLSTGASATTGWFGSSTCVFEGWDDLNQAVGWDYNSTAIATVAAGNWFHDVGGGLYTGQTPRTAVSFFSGSGSFITGSDFQLYGETS